MAGGFGGCFTRQTPTSSSSSLISLPSTRKKTHYQQYVTVNCCSIAPNNGKNKPETPQLLKIAVSGITELLRLVSSDSSAPDRTNMVDDVWKDEVSVLNVDDVLAMIKSDYEKAYFVTGLFTTAIYAEDCTFEDPTIKFQGRELYARNLSLLVPFFVNPSIQLTEIQKGLDSESASIIASWRLRTYLKLPWKPFIAVDGRTMYDLDESFRIVRHVESWNVSALEAIIQILTPSSGWSSNSS